MRYSEQSVMRSSVLNFLTERSKQGNIHLRHISFDRFSSISYSFLFPYQLQSSGDLTGAWINASKPVTVLAGSMYSSVGVGKLPGYLVEQLPPTNTWGKTFYMSTLVTRTSGDVIRLVGEFS